MISTLRMSTVQQENWIAKGKIFIDKIWLQGVVGQFARAYNNSTSWQVHDPLAHFARTRAECLRLMWIANLGHSSANAGR